MATRTQQTTPGRWVPLSFLAAIVAVLTIVGLAGSASAAMDGTAETRVRASAEPAAVLVGPPEHITAGQRLGEAAAEPRIVVATGVAANMDSFLPAGGTVRHSSTATAIGDDAATLTNFGRSQGAGGMHDVIVHGTADGRPIVNGNVTHARQIADAILENPSYTPGCSIRLVMCHGGREAAAQLSQMLDVDVLSTTRQAQMDPFTGQLLQGSF